MACPRSGPQAPAPGSGYPLLLLAPPAGPPSAAGYPLLSLTRALRPQHPYTPPYPIPATEHLAFYSANLKKGRRCLAEIAPLCGSLGRETNHCAIEQGNSLTKRNNLLVTVRW